MLEPKNGGALALEQQTGLAGKNSERPKHAGCGTGVLGGFGRRAGPVRAHAGIRGFRDQLADPRLLAMADRIWAEKDERPGRVPDAATVEIRLRSGEVYREEVVHPFGDDRQNPMSQADIEAKFRDCASYSKRPIPARDLERVIGMVADLENAEDVSAIVALL